jgi:TonB family protein
MTHALLYRPGKKRRLVMAFGVAVLIHVAAAGFAAIQQHEVIAGESDTGYNPPVIGVDLPENPTTPPDKPPTPPPIVNPTDDSFPEPQSIPPPVQQRVVKSVAPIHRESSGNPGLANLSTVRVFALSAPRPEYPYEARRSKITGEGIVGMTIDPMTGNVTDVSIWKSTGSPYLDNAATSAFRRWRFKTGSVSKVRVPITFTLTGASY